LRISNVDEEREQGRKGEERAASKQGAMANITASEIAGFGVGALLLIAALAAPKVDSFVARSQRRCSNI
jgi:hypothetical protein